MAHKGKRYAKAAEGIDRRAVYELTDRLNLIGEAEFYHFVGDAADSPITQRGETSQFRVGLGLSYEFGLDLF